MKKMTKGQAQEFLKGKKFYVNKKSKEIQEKLFELGFSWYNGKEVKFTYAPFLFTTHGFPLKIEYGDDMNIFIGNKNEEITAEQILNIEFIENPKFKIFDKVLVRDSDSENWVPMFFERVIVDNDDEELKFKTICGISWKYCIPYEGNENLVNKNL